MLSVELQIPGDDVEALVDIIYDEKLNKVLNASWKDILYPDLSAWCDIEVDWVSGITTK